MFFNFGHTIWNGDGGKAGAPSESTITNYRHTLGDGNRYQTNAAIESTFTNTCHAVGNSNGGEGSTMGE
jgi:hypothetical protein